MKKIYAKFTKERAEQFQIETGIYRTETGKKVTKMPLNEKCESHMQRILENYRRYQECGNEMLAESRAFGKGVEFEFVTGTSFCTNLLKLGDAGDKKRFLEKLASYKEYVVASANGTVALFQAGAEFEAVFGVQDGLENKQAGNNLNIDMTFDNLIETADGSIKVIDYEWIFNFAIPVDFIIYRAVFAFGMKYGTKLHHFIRLEEMYGVFGISPEDTVVYSKMNKKFADYVNGGVSSYDSILEQYKKTTYDLDEILPQYEYFVQLFINTGEGYSEKQSIKVQIKENQGMFETVFDLGAYEDIRELRLDPLNVPVDIELLEMTLTDENGISRKPESMEHNAGIFAGKRYIIRDADPQFIVPNDAGIAIRSMQLKYRFVLKDLEKYEEHVHIVEEMLETEIDSLETKIDSLQSEINRLKAEIEEKNKLIDELDYIKETKVFKLLLEKKVNNCFGGK